MSGTKDFLLEKFCATGYITSHKETFTMKIFACFALFCAVALTGCVQTKVEKMESRLGSVERQSFPTIENAKLELAVSGNPELISGKDRTVTFILRNLGNTPISIPEWFSNEQDNIEVSIQIWFPNTHAPEEDRWITYPVIPKRPVMRYPLRIGAKMFVSVEVPLEFLDNLIVKPGTERRYFIKAKLNLKSVSAESKVSAITIRAQEDADKKAK